MSKCEHALMVVCNSGIPHVKHYDLRSQACTKGFKCACVLIKANSFNIVNEGRSGSAGEGVQLFSCHYIVS